MSYSEDDYLMLSGIQHFYFCKKQWALIHINQEWDENVDTMMGNIIHEKTDNPYIKEKRGNVFFSRAMPVSSSKLGLSGILDTVEFITDSEGISIPGKNGKWKPYVIEYKKGKEKNDDRDIVQLVAQVICLEEYFGIKIDLSFIYYYSIKERIEIKITQELREKVYSLSNEMHELYQTKTITPAEYSNKCKRCSLYDICMPNLKSDRKEIEYYLNQENEI